MFIRQFDEMVSWQIDIKYDFEVLTGKTGKYFKNFLLESYGGCRR
ncbi:aminoglycoside 6-adenylyltransferase [Bacillus sp. UNC322MFChir4.1]